MPDRQISSRIPSLLALICLLALSMLQGCSQDLAMQSYLDAHGTQLTQAAQPEAPLQSFVVEPGMPARQIALKLVEQGIITDARLFEAYVRVNGLDGRLEAGTFRLSPAMPIPTVVAVLQRALKPGVTVTIPEGWRLEQVADHLSELGVVDGDAYRALAQQGSGPEIPWDRYPFLALRPPGTGLEGYLFPATYELPADSPGPADLIGRQLDAFSAQVLPLYAQYVETTAPEERLELHQILTLASIVEREAVVAEERAAIAGVYLNRLAVDMKLEADPTVQYAMGYQPATGQWWKTPVFLEEYAGVDSPYNTYLVPGIPPAPIAGPGLASIEAVIAPQEHDFLYFVALPDRSGGHVFARTFPEHVENVRRYRGQ